VILMIMFVETFRTDLVSHNVFNATLNYNIQYQRLFLDTDSITQLDERKISQNYQ
jgi:hypothetical protein